MDFYDKKYGLTSNGYPYWSTSRALGLARSRRWGAAEAAVAAMSKPRTEKNMFILILGWFCPGVFLNWLKLTKVDQLTEAETGIRLHFYTIFPLTTCCTLELI